MGAKLAAPKKLCVNVMGDASFGMTGMDIETAARNRIAILTVVFNNGVMGAERDVLKISDAKYGAMTVGGNYRRWPKASTSRQRRVEKPADIVGAHQGGGRRDRKGLAVPARIRGQGRPRLFALRLIASGADASVAMQLTRTISRRAWLAHAARALLALPARAFGPAAQTMAELL